MATASTLMNALDKHTPMQTGEKGHAEYGWSNDIQERIVQLSFQTVRTDESGIVDLGEKLYDIAHQLKRRSDMTVNTPSEHAIQEEARNHLDLLRRMVVHTRDIEQGKGEYALGREYIRQWYRLFPKEALTMIKYFVTSIPVAGELTHPYGSWKDIKFLWRSFGGEYCPAEVLGYLVNLVNGQLARDLESETPSLVARWVSRESSSKKASIPFKPFYRALAEDFFAHYLTTARTAESHERAKRKCYQHYRQHVLVPLNKKLNTPQVMQCAGLWASIDYKHDVTSITMRKQTKAFMNKNKDGTVRSEDLDRIQAAENFETFVNKTVEKGETIKGARVGFNTIAHDAWELTEKRHSNLIGKKTDDTELNVLDLQWESMLERLGDLSDMVPMIDLSGSMSGDPMDAAMGIGLAVACKSSLGKRAMTFSNTPQWMNLEGCTKLSEMMTSMYLYRNDWGYSTNFTAALKLILDKCVTHRIPASEVNKIKLLILSDMQINENGNELITDSMWTHISKMYADAGRRAVGTPYKPGHIIFWNLRHTGGFPALSSSENVTMFSGFSPVLLNSFAEKGLDALNGTSPISQLREQLNSERYNFMEF
jgi:hypothetical protein